jgi:ectoine hydroxylase-related dioxygenase (phytanoyl-CoA dioxygenase family)
MLTPAQIESFRRDGFVLGSRVLDEEQLDTLRGEMQRVIDDRADHSKPQPVMLRNLGEEHAPVWQIVNIWQASDAFRQLALNRTIAQEVAQLTDARELRIWHDQIQYKPAGKGGANHWHQDSPYWPPLVPKDQQVTAWVALDDADANNGCMSMVAGSHRWGDAIRDVEELPKFDTSQMPPEWRGHALRVHLCPVRAGHVHYHHALTWHGSQANKSTRPRRAIALHYMTEKTVLNAAGDHPMKPFIHVRDGEKIEGDAFPLVCRRD